MLKRNLPQNAKYHVLCDKLHKTKEIKVYDGRFKTNPIVFPPSLFSYNEFRVWIAELDLEYPRDNEGKPVSSTKLSKDEMNSHINFLDVLCAELGE